MNKQISLTTEELKKVLKGTNISKDEFLAKLTNVKTDSYKTEQLLLD